MSNLLKFNKKNLTLLTDEISVIRRFNLADCNLIKGKEKDILDTGCSFLTPVNDCPQEYDLVRIDGNNLQLGARPADRNMCSEEKRPKSLSLPLIKQSK
ncbi:hypothetical protein BH24ACI1_BH24ACI1_18780 [soil metagenome]|jgi:hypothetical protein